LASENKGEEVEKRSKFIQHAQKALMEIHNDLHILFRLSWELKELESGEN
jgi:hypothetical protein